MNWQSMILIQRNPRNFRIVSGSHTLALPPCLKRYMQQRALRLGMFPKEHQPVWHDGHLQDLAVVHRDSEVHLAPIRVQADVQQAATDARGGMILGSRSVGRRRLRR